MIARYFAFGHETPEQRAVAGPRRRRPDVPGHQAARAPARPPAGGPRHPGATAGANFQLPYRASFLLPHRRSAWLRFAERLDELADFADGLRPPEGADVVADVAGALRRAAANMTAHLDTG